MIWQLTALFLLLIFYTIYLAKMMVQRKKGIQTDQLARGKEKGRLFYTELIMKIATYSAVIAEVISVVLNTSLFPDGVRAAGLAAVICGVPWPC